ncbi:MAG: dihydroorotate dehydrogenase electron transfer subunit [Lachnospiraceae bacterium]|nr:dihydroorotate dehydrogenase electron transfer subunit [Lachnospiraceae bacterium]MCD7956540.1 dihydroorotate dehydrogenase electron transfer subunit [Lachnospiraceae bacterium]
MAEKAMIRAKIFSQEKIASQIYSMWLEAGAIAERAIPGQFVSVYSNDSGRLLPRPISICETEPARGALRLVYRVVGKGTAEFAGYQSGDTLDILGPLGNGFPLERCPEGKTAFLIGGGIGLPPMVELSKRLRGHALIVAGYRDELFLTEELAENGELYLSAEDVSLVRRLSSAQNASSAKNAYLMRQASLAVDTALAQGGSLAGDTASVQGDSLTQQAALTKKTEAVSFSGAPCSRITHGNVLDCIRENNLHADVIYACGPTPMLRALKAYAQENEIECWLSLEQRMACGIGACLGCVCESTAVDTHSQVRNKRVCKEGPVFAAEDVIL